ncbi:uncharacterized protein METZ01_LOCUS158507, partial [marine metagenome]
LTQNTSWNNAEKAIISLKTAKVLDIKSIHQMTEPRLSSLIRSSGFHRVKAKTLKSLDSLLNREFGSCIEKLKELPANEKRRLLLRIKGIGPETADDIMLYVLDEPRFVIDKYTKRIFSRVGKTPISNSYESWQKMLETKFGGALNDLKEYHGLLVTLGKTYCKKIPDCAECPLCSICVYGSAHQSK